MDRLRAVREAVARIQNEVVGKTPEEAAELCKTAGLGFRWLRVDGSGCMITADCRMDRIGFVINNGIVTEASYG